MTWRGYPSSSHLPGRYPNPAPPALGWRWPLYAVGGRETPEHHLRLRVGGGRYSLICLAAVTLGWLIRVPIMRPRWGPFHLLLILFTVQLLISRHFALDDYAAHQQFMMMFVPILFSVILVQIVRTEEQIYRALGSSPSGSRSSDTGRSGKHTSPISTSWNPTERSPGPEGCSSTETTSASG